MNLVLVFFGQHFWLNLIAYIIDDIVSELLFPVPNIKISAEGH